MGCSGVGVRGQGAQCESLKTRRSASRGWRRRCATATLACHGRVCEGQEGVAEKNIGAQTRTEQHRLQAMRRELTAMLRLRAEIHALSQRGHISRRLSVFMRRFVDSVMVCATGQISSGGQWGGGARNSGACSVARCPCISNTSARLSRERRSSFFARWGKYWPANSIGGVRRHRNN